MRTEQNEALRARIAELRSHMEEAGEPVDGEDALDALENGYVFEQKMKLVGMPGADALYAVPSDQDWAHDALGETTFVPGTLYVDGAPVCKGAAVVSGYFQADADGRWTRVTDGACPVDVATGTAVWVDGLEDFPEVMAQLVECMGSSAYRHAAEQAAMKNLVGA